MKPQDVIRFSIALFVVQAVNVLCAHLFGTQQMAAGDQMTVAAMYTVLNALREKESA